MAQGASLSLTLLAIYCLITGTMRRKYKQELIFSSCGSSSINVAATAHLKQAIGRQHPQLLISFKRIDQP